jgi:uncharacterized membrane protein YdjX (TVP38/TMEM64 family)
MLLVILCLIGTGLYVAFGTEAGAKLRSNPRAFHAEVHEWAAAHPVAAPAAVVGLYVILTVSMVPIWWIPVLAGAGLGLIRGIIWCEIGAMTGAVVTFWVSRWIAADWFHAKVESKMRRLRALDEMLSHNGLLVVLASRAIHVLPFGPSYYMFGLTKITTIDVALGTLLGYLPTCLLLAKTGAGWRRGERMEFVLMVAAIQGLLLVPVLLRYMAPGWFKKVGIE